MTLQEMCESAARYSDRYDEFVIEDGATEYEEDALHYFNVFSDAMNEAYFAAAKRLASPSTFKTVEIPDSKQIDLTALTPKPYQVRAVLNEEKTAALAFNFVNRDTLEVFVTGNLVLHYSYMPDRLEDYTDSPVFSEAAVDPMLYISLAVARMWQSEKKNDLAIPWIQDYYTRLGDLRSIQGSSVRRVGRQLWR